MSFPLEVTKLRKVYPPEHKDGQEFVAVNSISFQIKEGEVLGLLGPNGAGKSTTISMLLGILTPTSGQITYFGQDFATNRSHILNQVTFASTYIKLPWRLTVWENLKVYAYLYSLDAATFEKRAEKFLTRFGVWNQRHKTMNQLSAGQTTRVMLAKAFIPHPKIVLLDEPTASLDPDIAHQVRGFIREQQQEFNTTILYTSHNMDEVADVCDRVLFLRHGNVVAADTPDNLARSITKAKVTLTIPEDTDTVREFIQKADPHYGYDHHDYTVELDEHEIAKFLITLTKHHIHYTQISIAKPTLEDYFLHMSQN